MRLVSLRANKESFKTIIFKPIGLSIIQAIQVTEDKKDTFNSSGKSLAVSLIHFCLGSNPKSEFEKLTDWEFYLDFKINEIEYTASRATNNQKIIKLNDKEYSYPEFNSLLQSLVFFNIPGNTKFISFRGLISRFIRPNKSSYNSYETFIAEETKSIYPQMLNNSFLLGLDILKAEKKYLLKKELDNIEKLKKNIEKDPIMRDFFDIDKKDKTIDTDIKFYKDKIKKLQNDIDTFKIAENYDNIRKDADEIKASLKTYKNKATALQNAIRNIEKSIEIKPDISSNKILNFYEDAKVSLNDLVVKKLEEVENFNKKLLDNRKARLLEDKAKLTKQLKEINSIIKNIGKKQDEKLQLLDTHGTLDEYTSLNKELTNFTLKLKKLVDYKELLEKYSDKIEELKIDLGKENIETNKYLKENSAIKDLNIDLFNSFANEFYENKKAGIEIQNDTGENQLRYKINATIDDDAGDAVGNVKMFCFDWTLLKAQHNHNIKFLFHDSRILEAVDPRQIKIMFDVAFKNSKDEFQYIISANQKELDAIKNERHMTADEYKEKIEKNIVLSLSDEPDNKGKLLGIQINLNYDND